MTRLVVIAAHLGYYWAELLGVRVTSFKRSEAVNAQVSGSPTSWHLIGGAIDYGRETPAWKRAALDIFLTSAFHTKGTAPHYHAVGRPWGVIGLALVLVLVIAKVVR